MSRRAAGAKGTAFPGSFSRCTSEATAIALTAVPKKSAGPSRLKRMYRSRSNGWNNEAPMRRSRGTASSGKPHRRDRLASCSGRSSRAPAPPISSGAAGS